MVFRPKTQAETQLASIQCTNHANANRTLSVNRAGLVPWTILG